MKFEHPGRQPKVLATDLWSSDFPNERDGSVATFASVSFPRTECLEGLVS